MNAGFTRLVAITSLVLGVTVMFVAETRTPWSKFLESEAYRIAWEREFPDRDPSYRSTSPTPKWEGSVDSQKYERELQSLVTAPPLKRIALKIKYHVQNGAIPFGLAAGITWLLYGASMWIRRGFGVSSQ